MMPPRQFSIGAARRIVQDLFEPDPRIYWLDLMSSLAVGVTAFLIAHQDSYGWTVTSLAFLVSTIAFYRATIFTHELAHLKQGTFRGFRLAWNLCCGIPFLMPSFLYHTHLAHHMRRHFGTSEDGEYLPWAAQPVWGLLVYFCQALVMPLIAVVRFGLLTPLCWFSKDIRRFVQARCSAMVVDPRYVRPLPTRQERRGWLLQEVACCAVVWGTALNLALGIMPRSVDFVVQGYFTAVVILVVNQIRTLGAHRYTNTGGEMTFVEQMLDSVNYPGGNWLRALWAPLGLRYHALHHLFPSLPYHNLGAAHRRLMEQLPADSPYRSTNAASLFTVLSELWTKAWNVSQFGSYGPSAAQRSELRNSVPVDQTSI